MDIDDFVAGERGDKPHICPVCGGRGTVPASFYGHDGYSHYQMVAEELCRTCGGQGVVWSPPRKTRIGRA